MYEMYYLSFVLRTHFERALDGHDGSYDSKRRLHPFVAQDPVLQQYYTYNKHNRSNVILIDRKHEVYELYVTVAYGQCYKSTKLIYSISTLYISHYILSSDSLMLLV